MRWLAALLAAGWMAGGFATPAAAKAVDVSRPIETGGAVRVDVAYGRLRVTGSTPGRVRVHGEIDETLDRVTLGRDAGSLEVRVRHPLFSQLRSLWGDVPFYRADLTIEVPPDTRLFVVARDAEISIDGVTGPVGVGTISSAVEVRGEPARLTVETVSGDLYFDGRVERLRASTMSGHLEVRGAVGRLELEGVTGSLAVVDARVGSAELKTISGAVVAGGEVEPGGSLRIETDSGAVTLACCGATGLELDLATRDSEIVNQVGAARPVRDARGWRRLQLALGGGGAAAEVRTRSGLILVVPRLDPADPDGSGTTAPADGPR